MQMRMTPVVLNLLIINGLVFLAWQLLPADIMYEYFVLWKVPGVPWRTGYTGENFLPLQIITSFFSQEEVWHLFMNMFVLFQLGTLIETTIGARRFLIQYLVFGLVGGLLVLFLDPSPSPVLGASGAISGLLVVFAYLYPNMKMGLLFLPFRFKVSYFALGWAAFSTIFVVMSFFDPKSGFGISHFGHLMGMVVAFVYVNFPKLRKLAMGK